MRCARKSLYLPAAILAAGCLVAGCGSTASSVINNLPSKTGSVTARPSVTVTPPAGPTTTQTATATATATSTATVTETAAAPTTAAATSSAVSANGSNSAASLLWLWILLGVVVLAGLIALIVRSSRRRSSTAAGWQSRLIDAYAKGSALHDAMSVAEAQGGAGARDADARWYDIQRRADDLAQTLYALREAATDEADQARIADTLASLQAVRSAMEAERAPGGAGPQQTEVVRNRLYYFEESLRALRYGDEGVR